jgi:hypothetical protein
VGTNLEVCLFFAGFFFWGLGARIRKGRRGIRAGTALSRKKERKIY